MAKSNVLIRSKLKKARELQQSGQLHEAKEVYLKLYSSNKNQLEIGLELAVIYRKLGEFKQTENISKKIVDSNPKFAAAHHIYGSALQCLGHMSAAIEEYKIAIKLDPQYINAHYFLGNIYQLTNQYELAVSCFEKAVELSPNFFEALNNLAAVLIELRNPFKAKKYIDRALKLQPNANQLLCNLADFYLMGSGDLDKPLFYAKKAYNNDPNFIDAIKLLGRIYYQTPDYDKALEYYQKAYDICKDNEISGNIAQILERRGEFDAANKLITPLIQSGERSFAIILTYSALSRKFNNQQKAIEIIESTMKETTFDKPSLLNLHSELGKQYDTLKDYDNAFLNYQKANQLERELNQEMEILTEIIDLNNTNKEDIAKWPTDYPEKFWKNLPISDNESSRPIFVIGMFRSGTTLCEQILSSHPDVIGAGELQDINFLSKSIGGGKSHDQSPASLINVTKKKLNDAANSYLKTLSSHSTDSKNIVDKMPANFFHVGLISRMFPNAHIVHMIRDPRDVCLSMYFQRFGPQMTWSTDQAELADYHLAYQQVMQYWSEVLDIKILDVVYEDLMTDQETMTRKLLDFCDLEWNETCLNFHKNKRDVNTPSYDQVRKPLYTKSVARWKNYEAHIKPLLTKLETSSPKFLRN